MEAPHYSCPICKTTVARKETTFPFCSERCKTIDLGAWASGDYYIKGEPAYFTDEDEHNS